MLLQLTFNLGLTTSGFQTTRPLCLFLEGLEAKFQTLGLPTSFIHMFLRREVPVIQEVSDVYTSPSLYTDGLKMALRARKVSGAFEKRARPWGINQPILKSYMSPADLVGVVAKQHGSHLRDKF